MQVARLSKIMRDYCSPLLGGDFSMLDKIKEIEKKRVANLMDNLNQLSADYRKSHPTKGSTS